MGGWAVVVASRAVMAVAVILVGLSSRDVPRATHPRALALAHDSEHYSNATLVLLLH